MRELAPDGFRGAVRGARIDDDNMVIGWYCFEEAFQPGKDSCPAVKSRYDNCRGHRVGVGREEPRSNFFTWPSTAKRYSTEAIIARGAGSLKWAHGWYFY